MKYWFIDLPGDKSIRLSDSSSYSWCPYWIDQFSGQQDRGIVKKIRTYGQNINQVMVF